jgi:diadenosine tetraphosphate (Ap4A) HIT family hydrolase
MGELLRESINRVEQSFEPSSLRTCLFLGQIGGLKRQDDGKLQIHLIPRYKPQGHEAKEVIPIPPEVLEVAESLRRAESKLEKEEREFVQLET